MGTGRWYALESDNQQYEGWKLVDGKLKIYDQHGREMPCFCVDDDYVCDELNFRHENDPQWEGPWDASEEEHEAVYREIAEELAEELAA
jgi:hypothetical protein